MPPSHTTRRAVGRSWRGLTAVPGLLLALVALVLVFASSGTAEAVGPNAMRTGFDAQTMFRNDDSSIGRIPLGFDVNFFGQTFNSAYVNNNGNITFDSPLRTFTPFNLTSTSRKIIAPFFADVDTSRAGDPVRYGQGTVGTRPAFGVTWANVTCYRPVAAAASAT
jgi:hypothetical protein